MAEIINPIARIAAKLAARGTVGLQNNRLKPPSGLGMRLAPILALIGGAVALAGYFWFNEINGSGVNEPSIQRRTKTHLLEDPEAIALAPNSLQARLEWRDGRIGIALTWDPAANKVRIYRMPSGKSKYIEPDIRLARTFDFDITPGRTYTYVACAFTEEEQEFCSGPVSYELPNEKRR